MLKRNDKIAEFQAPGKSAAPDAGTGQPRRSFFERVDWGVFWIVFLGMALFYAYTQAPTVTLEDSGELVVAADYLGVPHPPGYPLWTIAAWFFTRIFRFVTYMGQPNPAWGVNFCSGFFGALTCALVAMLVSRLGAIFGGAVDDSGRRQLRWPSAVGGVAAGYLLGFNGLFWSQSVIAEVYTINAFLHMLILLLSVMWIYRGQDNRILYWMSFVFGVSITNCQPIVFLGPSLLIVFYFTDRPLFRDCMALGLALVGAYMLRSASLTLPGVQVATHRGAKTLVAVLMLASPLAIWLYTRRLLTEWRRIVIMTLCLGLGLSLFVYLPIASDFNPPMNWG
ncbi:MAG: DUF2723 domain-containing protein, partial [Lentisphaerae bacterium]|nr:DUF2723 domain-containing protein [Lentisphaerota bacterium]